MSVTVGDIRVYLRPVLGLVSSKRAYAITCSLLGDRMKRCCSEAFFSRVVSGFCLTSNIKVRKVAAPGHLCESFQKIMAKAKRVLIKYCYVRSQYHGF